jgi:hypothetical protein
MLVRPTFHVKFKSAVLFFALHLTASLVSMPLFHSAIDKLYRSIGQAPAEISMAEGSGALVFQILTIPLLFIHQVEHSVFSFQDSMGTVWPALLRLIANSVFYVLVGFLSHSLGGRSGTETTRGPNHALPFRQAQGPERADGPRRD